MRLRIVTVTLVLAVVSSFVSSSPAEPLDLKQIPVDATWVVHVDVDAVWKMTLVKQGWQKMLETRQEAEERLKELRGQIGLDITKDVHGVTAYGWGPGADKAVVILHAKVDKKLLLGMMTKAPDYKVASHASHRIHTWTAPQRQGPRTVAATFFKAEAVVLASSPDQLKVALDTLSRKGPGVSISPLAGKVPQAAALLVRVGGLSEADLPGRMQMLRQIDSAQFVVGEKKGNVFVRAEVVMANEEVVGQVKTLIDGGLAMAKQASADNEQAKKLLDALKVKVDSETLTISLSLPADEILKMAEDAAQRAAERRQGRSSRPPSE